MKRAALFAIIGSIALLTPLAGQDLEIRPGFASDQWLDRKGPVELGLSRELKPTDGRLAVFVDHTDLTALFEQSAGRLTYAPGSLPLPSGEHQLIVYLVSPEGTWTEKGRFPIRVRLRGGLDRVSFQPALDLSNKGQLDESQRPESTLSSRSTFQDATMQGGWRTELQRSNVILRSNLSTTGVSYVNEALRFGQLGDRAPRLDLASYDFQLERGPARVSVGHVSFGGQRHLVSGFGSRGVLFTLDLGRAVSLHLAGLNGTSIVGWDNVLGLSNDDHQMLGAGLGVEIIPSRPGALRVEGWLLDGSLQPLDNFNQGAIRSAEKSQGHAWRVMMTDPSQRLSIEGGYAVSRFEEARDLQLEEGIEVTPLNAPTRDALYANVSLALVRNRTIGKKTALNLSVGSQIERVEPLYRSVAAYAQADVFRRSFDLNGSLGPLNLQLTHLRMEDNLGNISSILSTQTEQSGANASLDLASLISSPKARPWIPSMTATFNRTHQFGEGIPEDSGFNATHIPDQISTNATAGLNWSFSRFRVGYQWNRSEQDNRQPSRERADFDSGNNGLTLTFTPVQSVSIGLNLSRDEQHSLEANRRDRTERTGVNLTWRVFGDTAVAANYGKSRSRDDDRTSENNASDSYVEVSSGFSLWQRKAGQPARTRLFLRYADRQAGSFNRTFGTSDERRGWTVTSGVNVNLF